MKKIAINGRIFEFPLTGVGRFCVESLKEMDKISSCKDYVLVVSQKAENIPKLHNIKVKKTKIGSGILWEQIVFPFYALLHGMKTLNMSNSLPLIKPNYVVIHDISLKENKNKSSSFADKLKIWWPLLHYRVAAIFSIKIFTVSEFQKKAICNNYRVDKNRVVVVYNGWQHMEEIVEDDSIIDRLDLRSKNYFFALSTRAKNKNFIWVIEEAKNNPSSMFVVAGKLESKYFVDETDLDSIDNIITTGYISDSNMKSLMKNAKAFLYPSIYEGFGIPPLEAISVGTKAIVSNATCLPEIYGESVYYINPYKTDYDLIELLNTDVESKDLLLNKYSWEKTAKIMVNAIGYKEETK